MGLFDYFFPPAVVTCDICGAKLEEEPIVHKGRDYCKICDGERRARIELQRQAEEEARERIIARQRFND